MLGGNGTIEDMSPLPRLYREVPVQESWEGPHGTLMAQLVRDAARAKMHGAFTGSVQAILLDVEDSALGPVRERALAELTETRERLDTLLRGDLEVAAYHARGLFGRLGRLLQVAVLLEQADRDAASRALGWLPAAAQLLLAGAPAASADAIAASEVPSVVTAIIGA